MIYYLQNRRKTVQTGKGFKMASKASLENALRNEILDTIVQALSEHFDLDPVNQIEKVASGAIILPLLDGDGNEKYPKVVVSIPRGARDGNGGYIPFNGHDAAVEYREEQENRERERAMQKALRDQKKKEKEKEKEEE